MKRQKRKELSLPILLLIGAGISLASVLTMTLILAIASYFTKDPTSLVGAFSLLSLLLAGAISGFVNARIGGEGGALIGIISASVASLIMLSVGLIWRGGMLPLSALLNLTAFILTSVGSAILGKKRARSARKRRFR